MMLSVERCAVLLRESMPAEPVGLDAVTDVALSAIAMQEMKRILSARAQIRTVSMLAESHGFDVILLKGSADVARGLNVPSADVDVLLRPDEARRFLTILDGHGFTPGYRTTRYHYQPRSMDNALHIEVHFAITGFDDPSDIPWNHAAGLDAMPRIHAFRSCDHAWTLLCHMARSDVVKRYRVRDLVMLQRALDACSTDEAALLSERIAADSYCAVMRLLQRRVCRQSEGGTDDDLAAEDRRIRRLYLMYSRLLSLPRNQLTDWLTILATPGTAIGPVASWRQFRGWRRGEGFERSMLRKLIRKPAWAAVALGAFLLTADAPFMRSDRHGRQ